MSSLNYFRVFIVDEYIHNYSCDYASYRNGYQKAELTYFDFKINVFCDYEKDTLN